MSIREFNLIKAVVLFSGLLETSIGVPSKVLKKSSSVGLTNFVSSFIFENKIFPELSIK